MTGVVLVDDDKEGRIAERRILEAFHGLVPVVRTHAKSGDKESSGHELEDLFDRAYYVDLVNASHLDVKGFEPLQPEALDSSMPMTDAVAKAFKDAKLGKFGKLRPAQEFYARVEVGKAPLATTRKRFASLFERLNREF